MYQKQRCIYIYIYISIHICIRICICIRIRIHTQSPIHVHIHVYAYILHIYTYIDRQSACCRKSVRTECVHVCMCVCERERECVCACVCVCVCVCVCGMAPGMKTKSSGIILAPLHGHQHHGPSHAHMKNAQGHNVTVHAMTKFLPREIKFPQRVYGKYTTSRSSVVYIKQRNTRSVPCLYE